MEWHSAMHWQQVPEKCNFSVCVYLWATTPVLISVLTFVSYALSGNELTAPKVFTSVALFAMLTGPLNAFPWVLNGLVEAMVSVR